MKNDLKIKAGIQGCGPIRQLGYVVQDIEVEMSRWQQEENLGPWLLMRNVKLPCLYRGKKSKPIIHVALAYRGNMQIELIQQVNEDPSPYREVIDSGDYGLHHTAHLVPNMKKAVSLAQTKGFDIVCDIRMMGSRYVYLQSPAADRYIEFLPASLMMRTIFKQGIAAAKNWDGRSEAVTIDLRHIGTLLGSLPSAARAWWGQR